MRACVKNLATDLLADGHGHIVLQKLCNLKNGTAVQRDQRDLGADG